ncbi:WD domain, G-beta repeat protein (macronuclear) [Tetrahymena thermophila SB210]|uniref:WD domain, G-beta repeat protein n=1 Tax=Tetrahymena thermophila (strain SB210) TaxID=312017 RepID=Q22N56_TETTS|nr:WD domain, G-beta repeat protein [Tetrahymena thermophila SB210]EAR86929.1 WD domain, G-beta repeat protein [Tetrahymena thermophila SB210]|eukprot:XP_001007174.1 WD domain, G-beta repeat protein [Tetrahymena thermophila SB210]
MNQHYIQKQKEFQDAQKLTQQEIYELQERQKYEAIYSPRTSLKRKRDEEANLLSEILLKLDPFTLSILKNDFEAAGGELKVNEFVIMMRHHLSDWRQDLTNREQKLNICLSNFFEQVDMNLNGLLAWDELSNFVMGKSVSLNNKRKDVVKQYTKQDVDINYKVKSSIIKKVIYISDIDKVAFFEEGSCIVQILNHIDGTIVPKPLKIEPDDYLINSTSIKKDNQDFYYIDEKIIQIKMVTHILDIIYISDVKHKCLMVSTTDKFVRAYKILNGGFVPLTEIRNNTFVKEQMLFKHEVNCMSWDDSREILFCGELDGSIELWNLNKLYLDKEEQGEKLKKKGDTNNFFQFQKNIILQGGHNDIITSLICLPKLQFMVSGGLDCKINLWDTIENKIKFTFKGHTRGITSLAFDPATILLFSAGFDHWIGVWNPYTEHMVYKISDFRNSLQHIIVIEGSNQLISLDIKGNVKVRDIQKFKERQNFSIQQDEHGFNFNPVYFTCIKSTSLKLIFCGQSIAAYNYDYGFNPNVCDDLKPLCCIMNTRQIKFYTPAGPRLKVWCGLTGEVDKIFLDMSQEYSEITAFCLDSFEKRMIIGDKKGYVNSFNCENGAKIKSHPKHSAPVIFIKDCLELGVVVTVSSDNIINIVSNHYDDDKDSLLRSIKLLDHYITCIDIYIEYNSIVLGFYTGQVGFFDMNSGKFLGQYSDKLSNHQVTDIMSLPDMPFVVSSCQNGQIQFISGPPLFYKFQVVESFQNIDQELFNKDSELEDVGVSKIKYCKENQQLFVADFKGYLKCYDISKIISNLSENIEQLKLNSKLKEDKHTFYKSMREYFQFNVQTEPTAIWNTKATSEQITFLEYNDVYKLLFACISDKNVMIFDSVKGQYIDSLRQNEDSLIQIPIGYRKKNTIELYDHSLKIRIDRTKEEDEQIERQKKLDYLTQMKKKMKQQQKLELQSNMSQLNSSFNQSYYDSELQSPRDDKSILSSSKGMQSTSGGPNNIFQMQGSYENKDEQNDAEMQLDDQNKNIFLTNNDRKSRQFDQVIEEADSSRSIQEEQENDIDSENTKDPKNEAHNLLDDRNVYLQYPECEFNAFYFWKLVKKEPYASQKSKPQWKLELDIKAYYEKYLEDMKKVEQSINELEKKTKIIQIQNQKFKIMRFEVDLSKFDPQHHFQPKVAANQKEEDLDADEESIDAKTIAMNYQKKLIQNQEKKDQEQRVKINYNQIWENLSKNKTNSRFYDSRHYLQLVKNKPNLTKEQEDKILEVYQALKGIEQIDQVEEDKKDKKSKTTIKENTKKAEILNNTQQTRDSIKSLKQQKEIKKGQLDQQILQGKRGLLKLKKEQSEPQVNPESKTKTDQEIDSQKRNSTINSSRKSQRLSKLAIENQQDLIDEFPNKQDMKDDLNSTISQHDENKNEQEQALLFMNSKNEKIQNYLKLLEEQKQQNLLLFGSENPTKILKSQQTKQEIQVNHTHQHSVTQMIAQAFNQDNSKELDLDQMVKRITEKFNK